MCHCHSHVASLHLRVLFRSKVLGRLGWGIIVCWVHHVIVMTQGFIMRPLLRVQLWRESRKNHTDEVDFLALETKFEVKEVGEAGGTGWETTESGFSGRCQCNPKKEEEELSLWSLHHWWFAFAKLLEFDQRSLNGMHEVQKELMPLVLGGSEVRMRNFRKA